MPPNDTIELLEAAEKKALQNIHDKYKWAEEEREKISAVLEKAGDDWSLIYKALRAARAKAAEKTQS